MVSLVDGNNGYMAYKMPSLATPYPRRGAIAYRCSEYRQRNGVAGTSTLFITLETPNPLILRPHYSLINDDECPNTGRSNAASSWEETKLMLEEKFRDTKNKKLKAKLRGY